MQRTYGKVDLDFRGETVFVIGGGPSLEGFDFSVLEDKITIGANDAGILSNADTVITLDRNYYRHRLDSLVDLARNGKTVYSALPDSLQDVRYPEEITHLRFKRGRGLSPSPDMIYGLNSGFAALNVAYLARPVEIRLLGFDFQFKPDRPHWHEEYPWFKQKNDTQIRRWTRAFDAARQNLDAAGIRVVNYVGPTGSAIVEFDKRPLERVLE